jgi:threonine synthase
MTDARDVTPTTPKFQLECGWCGARFAQTRAAPRCASCNGPLVVRVELDGVARDPAGALRLRDESLPGLWPWFDLLPIVDRRAIVSLGEGGTPLLEARRLGRELGVSTLLLKDETRNPTGSFKDRMLAVGVTRAVECGHDTVAVQSSGNVGAAAAAYAARAGLRATVFVPRTAPDEKLLQARMYGADVLRIDCDSPADIFELLSWACDEFGWHLVSTAAIYNPFTLEGAKTVAYEIAVELDFDLPEWMIVPVGGGGNIGSLWRGLLDLRALGLVGRLPRMVGVQAAGCAPFVAAIANDRTPQDALIERWPAIDTVAGAIADDVVFDAHIALPAVRESDGTAVAVADADTLAMVAALARAEGIFVEPAAATGLAAVRGLAAEGRITSGDRVLCLLTGHGLKDPGTARTLLAAEPLVPFDRAAVAARVRKGA